MKTGAGMEAPAESSGSVDGYGYERRTNAARQPQTLDGPRRRAIAARRRKRRRQRRLILCGFFLLLALFIVGGIFGVNHYRNTRAKQALIEQGITAIEQESYEAAIDYLDQAVGKAGRRIGKLETDALLYRAEAEYQQGDYAAALHSYGLLLKQDSKNVLYQKGAALCLMETGDYAAALEYQVANGQVYNRMARDQIQAGQYDEALASIEQGRTFEDETAARDLDYNEAVIWEYKGDFAKALQLFETYVDKYGADENVSREITFLKTR
ncbi:MAG: tetratricopeptide repeat protein [Lachnospiraceae bacterium]|nr:tetratricopeptide repeat protein [Lachnospiraceae bacterium]